MKRVIFALMVCLLLGAAVPAGASDFYLIEDSDTRMLTEEELWEWQYEALGYILHEIYARHGYHFESGSSYAMYFAQQDWFMEKPLNVSNEEILEDSLSALEKHNERLIKRVQSDMQQIGTLNEEGRGLLPEVYAADEEEGSMLSFTEMDVEAYRTLKVYSGPGTKYYRGANGKATVSANGAIYIAGREGDWVLVQYDTNDGTTRVGYIDANYIDNLRELEIPELEFEYREVTVRTDYELTDDPKVYERVIGQVKAGEPITYLIGYRTGDMNWAYVEAEAENGKKARGFVPAELIMVSN